MFRICLHQLKLSLLSPKFYIALMVGVVIQTVTAVPLLEYVKATGQPICLFEGFLYYNSDIFSVAAASLGIVLMVSDIPFSTQNETYTLMRVSRKKWIGGKVLYLLCACIIFYLVSFTAFVKRWASFTLNDNQVATVRWERNNEFRCTISLPSSFRFTHKELGNSFI